MRRAPAAAALLLAPLLALTACATRPAEPGPEPTEAAAEPAAARQSTTPPRAAEPDRPGIAGLADPAWIAETAALTGIPERALRAYAGAAITKAEQMPQCGLGWNTIAAVGFAESDHARYGGRTLGEDGLPSEPIFGLPLDGRGVEEIPDSDGGEIDGDAEFDRAVGPMQLIPQTWRNWHVDAGADGIEDPQQIDDAVLATANYLCRAAGEGMVSAAGWRQGIRSYNTNPDYLVKVSAEATRFADLIGTAPAP